ncbi:MAG TPA: acylphosphatase [Geopsychrobacteraceae bacterium]|nr:acylphosphatase [Geopsychrobacteraceae bacterium]
MSHTRATLIIKGRVQGVFYRQSTKEAAQSHKVSGWVRNLPNGDVKAVLEGHEKDVKNVIAWCWGGPPAAKVENIIVDWSASTLDFSEFSIR